jgi:NAD(P)-dependent dehydrogenase (short-subunit alcohol dehydrogenase family)
MPASKPAALPGADGEIGRSLNTLTSNQPGSRVYTEGDPIMAETHRFTNKVVFISGAASGIGRAAALAFAAEGARVAILDRSEEALQKVETSVKDAGGEVLAIACDVSSPDQIEAAIKQLINRFGRLDIAFNNAGVENKAAPVHEIDLAEWDRILGINLRGTFICMKHELAQMVKQGCGVVVNSSSGAGIRGVAGGAAYAVLPGNIETPMMDRFTGGDIQKAIDLEPVGRLGKPEEIAEAVLWMASDLGGFVTGAATVIDGGWSL